MSDKPKKSKKINRNTWVKGVLRSASFRWRPRNEAMVRARVERGKYKCEICEEIFGPKEIQLDHKIPVVDPKKGFTTFDDYIERLFCDVDGFSAICVACHDAKTRLEDEMRQFYKSEKEEYHDFKKEKKSKKKLDKPTEE
jgi:hypothetical protein